MLALNKMTSLMMPDTKNIFYVQKNNFSNLYHLNKRL